MRRAEAIQANRNLEQDLEDCKEAYALPPSVSKVSLYYLGCNSATRLKNAIKGNRWFSYTSEQEVLMRPGSPKATEPEYKNQAWFRLTLL